MSWRRCVPGRAASSARAHGRRRSSRPSESSPGEPRRDTVAAAERHSRSHCWIQPQPRKDTARGRCWQGRSPAGWTHEQSTSSRCEALMSVVEQLPRTNGRKSAFGDLSFSVNPDVVTGFGAPNGSGESTTTVRTRSHAIRQVMVVEVAGRLSDVVDDLDRTIPVSYTHLRAHETVLDL